MQPSQRVALSTQLALKIGYTHEQADRVRIAGLVHDVSKIGVPGGGAHQGRTTHRRGVRCDQAPPEIGHRILRDIRLLRDVPPGVLHHHPRWDPRPYPAGAQERRDPPPARIIALADTFDAMSSEPLVPLRPAASRCWRRSGCRRAVRSRTWSRPFVSLDFSEYDRMVEIAAANRSTP